MKNLTLVLILSAAALTGCKKKDGDAGAAGSGSGSGSGGGSATMAAGSGSAAAATPPAAAGGGDCAAAFDHAMSIMMDSMKKEMPQMTDAMVNKMKSVAVQHCNDDKWDAAVLKCFVDGKVADDIEKCDKGLTKDQKEKFDKDLEAAMAAMMPKDGSGAAPAGAAGGDGDLPAECKDYKAAMEKLAACDKLPKESKDALKQGYDAMSQGWAQVGALPPEAKKAMADGCKQGADALVQTGKALCGW